MGLKIYKISPSYGHPPYQGGQGGSSVKYIVSLILTSYLYLVVFVNDSLLNKIALGVIVLRIILITLLVGII